MAAIVSDGNFHHRLSVWCRAATPARFQKFNDAVPIVIAQRQERLAGRARLAAMCQNRGAHRGKLSVMEKRELIAGALQLLGDELPVAGEETR